MHLRITLIYSCPQLTQGSFLCLKKNKKLVWLHLMPSAWCVTDSWSFWMPVIGKFFFVFCFCVLFFCLFYFIMGEAKRMNFFLFVFFDWGKKRQREDWSTHTHTHTRFLFSISIPSCSSHFSKDTHTRFSFQPQLLLLEPF